MKFFAVVLLSVLACANAGIIAAPSARILQGPSSSATIVGPDGSSISSIAPGGIVVADAAPAVVAAAPAAVLSGPGLVARSSVLPGLGGTIIAGPAGTITSSETLVAAPLAWL